MESPLTTFMYVLLRDHLPAGTVRWLIQQAQLPGDPADAVPELEALAERLGNELLMAPPRNGNNGLATGGVIDKPLGPLPGETPPPKQPRKRRARRSSVREQAILDYVLSRPGELISGAEIEAAVDGLGSSYRSSICSKLVKEEKIIAAGTRQSRRFATPGTDIDKLMEERPPPHNRPNTGKGTGDGKASVATIASVREFIEERGTVKPKDLDVLGFSSATRARVIRHLREEGMLKITYDGHQRILVWVPEAERETSEPDHDDAGEGDVPVDPAGETEGGERQPEEAASPSAGAIVDSDDDGGQSGAPDAAASTGTILGRTGSRAKGEGESDVELMARVGDYITESEHEDVWPGEIEAVFSLNKDRRRKIISMLVERNRIEVTGSGVGTRYRHYRAPNAGDYRLNEGEHGPGVETGLRLKKPERPKTDEPTREERSRVRGWALGQVTFRRRGAQEAFPDIDSAALGKILLGLCNEKVLEVRGGEKHGVPSYAVLGRTGENTETLEGRLVSWLGGKHGVTAEVAARGLGVQPDAIDAAVNRLEAEGQVVRSAAGDFALV